MRSACGGGGGGGGDGRFAPAGQKIRRRRDLSPVVRLADAGNALPPACPAESSNDGGNKASPAHPAAPELYATAARASVSLLKSSINVQSSQPSARAPPHTPRGPSVSPTPNEEESVRNEPGPRPCDGGKRAPRPRGSLTGFFVCDRRNDKRDRRLRSGSHRPCSGVRKASSVSRR